MREIMDRLLEARTAIDDALRRQRNALATIGAIMNYFRLEAARADVRKAIRRLSLFEPDALPPKTSGATLQTPTSSPGEGRP